MIKRRSLSAELRSLHSELLADFKSAVTVELHHDDVNDNNWRNHMIAALVDSNDNTTDNKLMEELPDEFFRMVRWLPGGRFKGRELIFDSVVIQ